MSYNIDNLNFKNIKNEINNVPNFIKNKSRLSFRSSTSFNNSNNNSYIINNDNNNTRRNKGKSLSTGNFLMEKNYNNIINNNQINESNFSNINNNNNNNNNHLFFKVNYKIENPKQIENIETENQNYLKNIEILHNKQIFDIKKLFKEKMKIYEIKIKELSNIIIDYQKNYISLIEHKNIINNLNEKYKKLLNEKKSDYDKFNYNINNLMKYSEKYKGLLQRLSLYKNYELEIDEIEKKIFFEIYNKNNNNNNNNNNKNNNNKNSNEIIINDYYLINKLQEDIKYNQIVFEMKENLDNFLNNINNDEISMKCDNLIKNISNKFDMILNVANNDIKNKNINNKNNINNNNNKYNNNIIDNNNNINIDNFLTNKTEIELLDNNLNNDEVPNKP